MSVETPIIDSEPSGYTPPTADEIEAYREELGVQQIHLSYVIGYDSSTSYNVAIEQEAFPTHRRVFAHVALSYVDEHGYLPLPREVVEIVDKQQLLQNAEWSVDEQTDPYGLRIERYLRDATQADVAKEIGVNLMTVARWENGEQEPSEEHQELIELWIEGML